MKDEQEIVSPITDEEIFELMNKDGVPPAGVPHECECFYEYDPKCVWSTVNLANCCDHCTWKYNTRM